MPYVFHDPVSLDKKIDPHKLKFGSKICAEDFNNVRKENYYSVKEIIDVNLLKLNTGITVRLPGIKKKEDSTYEAIEFLRKKIQKGLIYLAKSVLDSPWYFQFVTHLLYNLLLSVQSFG